MKISIQAKPGVRENKVEKIDDSHFVVFVKEPPIQGKANRAIERLLADYFNVPPYQVRIVSGFTSRQKVVEVSY